jgi:polyisoprenoid-binding protein YceI
VKETLFGASTEAVGRTSDVTGSIAINGTTVSEGSFTVDMNSVSSDRTQRDGQFRGRIMNTSQFPTATFKLTSPITLPSVEADKEVNATATGNLTLHGVTKKVTFDVVAKRVTGQIKVNGSIPIHFSDYDINNPSGGPAQVGNDGTLEFTLVFTR